VLRYSRDRIVTMQYGAGVMDANGKRADGSDVTTIDHTGLYMGNERSEALPTNHVLESGLVRTADFRSAVATLK
jgi:hypothetical protein